MWYGWLSAYKVWTSHNITIYQSTTPLGYFFNRNKHAAVVSRHVSRYDVLFDFPAVQDDVASKSWISSSDINRMCPWISFASYWIVVNSSRSSLVQALIIGIQSPGALGHGFLMSWVSMCYCDPVKSHELVEVRGTDVGMREKKVRGKANGQWPWSFELMGPFMWWQHLAWPWRSLCLSC